MNIAEGCGKQSNRELARFLDIAMGSAKELDYQLLLARDVGVLSTLRHEKLSREAEEVRRMLYALTKKVRASAEEESACERVRGKFVRALKHSKGGSWQ
jgi:four helix bundle protein